MSDIDFADTDAEAAKLDGQVILAVISMSPGRLKKPPLQHPFESVTIRSAANSLNLELLACLHPCQRLQFVHGSVSDHLSTFTVFLTPNGSTESAVRVLPGL